MTVSRPSRSLLLVWLAAAAALGVAFTLQFGFAKAPCHLCLYERVPYYAVLGILPVATAIGRPRLGLVLAGLLLLGNAGLSGYHVAVEQGWTALPASCVAGGTARTIEELRAELANAAPTCDQVSVTFLGISLAAWNLLFAAAMGVFSLLAARRSQ